MILKHQLIDLLLDRESEKNVIEKMNEDGIESQYIGKISDDIMNGKKQSKISFRTRLKWKLESIKNMFYNAKYAIADYIKWHKAIGKIRSWEGYDGLITVMICQLRNYIEAEEKYGYSEAELKKSKIASAKDTIEVLERIKYPHDYLLNLHDNIQTKYPDYKHLVTRYKNGGVSYGGDFIAYGNGWVGKESKVKAREGYFEFMDGKFTLVDSPNQNETDKLLNELSRYYDEMEGACQQAKKESDADFEQLKQLLKKNVYSW